MRLIDFFDRGVTLGRKQPCLKDDSGTRTYGEVQLRSYEIAAALIRDGVKSGAKAAVYCGNRAATYECLLGILRAGCVWVPVNPKNAVSENAGILENCDVEVLFYEKDLVDAARAIAADGAIGHLICVDPIEGNDGIYLEDWVAGVEATDPDIVCQPWDIATIASTGGTTGRPKGVLTSHLSWETKTISFLASMPPRKRPVHLVVAPISHAAGSFGLMLMAVGATQIILKGFDAEKIMQTIERECVTHLFLPPTAIYMLLAHPDVRKYDYSSLEYFIYAAAPMSVEKLRECIDIFGPVMSQVFGQVEAPLMCTHLSPEEHVTHGDPVREKRLASCGRPTILTQVAIMDEFGSLASPNVRGEIVVRGNLIMSGYYKNPEATAEVSQYGWHHTGDIGVIDDDGYVYIVDRKKDMIISGGFNIYPSEVEQAIWRHPAVQDCAVIGVPDPKWGEAVKAVIELKPNSEVEAEDIIDLCKKTLGSIKAPKMIEFWPSLPRSPAGKVLKKEIRAKFWKGHERAI